MRRGFLNIYPAAAVLSINFRWLFQLCVLGSGCDEDGNVGVGVLSEREEIFIGGTALTHRIAFAQVETITE